MMKLQANEHSEFDKAHCISEGMNLNEDVQKLIELALTRCEFATL
jgi:hypothetical protein